MNRFDELAKAMSRGRALKLLGASVLVLLVPQAKLAEAKKKKRHKKSPATSQVVCVPPHSPCTLSGTSCCGDPVWVCQEYDYCAHKRYCNTYTGTPPSPPGLIRATCSTPTCTSCSVTETMCRCVPEVGSGKPLCVSPEQSGDGGQLHYVSCETEADCSVEAPGSKCADFSSCPEAPDTGGPTPGKVCARACRDCP